MSTFPYHGGNTVSKKSRLKSDGRPKRIAAYVRVSSQRQALEGDSLEAQQNAITRWIEDRKQCDDWRVQSIEFYIDAGRSAKDQNRPELQRLRQDIEAGNIDTVVCFKIDRITRSLLDFADLWNFFQRHGVELVSLKERVDTSNAMGEAMVMIIMVFAQLERKLTGERTVATMQDRAERGLWNGGHVYGYISDPNERGRLRVDPEAAATIRTHFFDAVEKLGAAGAVQWELARLNIRTPAKVAKRSGRSRGGKPFTKQQILGILRNRIYLGRVSWGDAACENAHEPIITAEQFERVQKLLAWTTARRTNTRYSPGRQYLLSCLVRCRCGAMMTGRGAVGRSRTHHYYECTRQIHAGRSTCDSPRFAAEPLEEAILARVRALSLPARERVVEEAMRQLTVDTGRVEHELSTARTRLVTVNREINNLVGVIAQGGLNSLDTIKAAVDERTAEKGTLEGRIEELTTQLTPAQEVNDAARQFLERWGQVGILLDAANPTERRLILQHLIEVVELRSAGGSGVAGGGGTYAIKLFTQPPERGEWEDGEDSGGDDDGNADGPVLTGPSLVRMVDEKAPRVGFEPTTRRLTAGCSTIELSRITLPLHI